MYTSNYARAAKRDGAIAISIGKPWWYRGPSYPPLYPDETLLRDYKAGGASWGEYIVAYNQHLATLDPHTVVAELTMLACDNEPMLLCWEGRDNPYCPRRLVVTWLERTTGIVIPEWRDPPKIT